MISIIICTALPARGNDVREHWTSLLSAEPFELILIEDARSLAEAYNRGIDRSRGDVLIFAHDDIEILTDQLVPRLRKHLESYDLLGVAGTTRLSDGNWLATGIPYVFGQVAYPQPYGYNVCIYGAPGRPVGGIQALDGLFLACKRHVVEAVRFDERTFDGFHGYDADFSFAAYLAGFRLAVCHDIPIFHLSSGTYDEIWEHYLAKFAAKYEGRLAPPLGRGFRYAMVQARTKAEIVEIMCWDARA